jgi:hypothetical protein
VRVFFPWVWVVFWLWFAFWEAIGLYHEWHDHKSDEWTLTHFLASQIPLSLRVVLLAWLTYHFLWEHKNG